MNLFSVQTFKSHILRSRLESGRLEDQITVEDGEGKPVKEYKNKTNKNKKTTTTTTTTVTVMIMMMMMMMMM